MDAPIRKIGFSCVGMLYNVRTFPSGNSERKGAGPGTRNHIGGAQFRNSAVSSVRRVTCYLLLMFVDFVCSHDKRPLQSVLWDVTGQPRELNIQNE